MTNALAIRNEQIKWAMQLLSKKSNDNSDDGSSVDDAVADNGVFVYRSILLVILQCEGSSECRKSACQYEFQKRSAIAERANAEYSLRPNW